MIDLKPSIQRSVRFCAVTALLMALTLSTISLVGCEGDSSEEAIRQVALIIAGLYQHPNDPDSLLVGKNTGALIRRLDLKQSGDQLEGSDNNGIRFVGTIGRVIGDDTVTFTLEGATTDGEKGTIAGSITVEGTEATMSGTWAEPSIFSTVFGVAVVPSNSPPSTATDTNATTTVTDTNTTTDTSGDMGGGGTNTNVPPPPG